MSIKRAFLNNVGLKMLALFFALITWFYVLEATKLDSERAGFKGFFSSGQYTSKNLYVKPIFVGSPPKGYFVDYSNTKIKPEAVLVIGPDKVLLKTDFIPTKHIDLDEYTRSASIDVGLGSISPLVQAGDVTVKVDLVIKRARRGLL